MYSVLCLLTYLHAVDMDSMERKKEMMMSKQPKATEERAVLQKEKTWAARTGRRARKQPRDHQEACTAAERGDERRKRAAQPQKGRHALWY